jgi:DinB superfamily
MTPVYAGLVNFLQKLDSALRIFVPRLVKNDHDSSLRQHLLELLKGGSAHARFEEAIAGIPAKLRGQKPAGLPHTPWMLLEHLRIAQWDILEFSRNRKHKSPDWPKDYWPRREAPPSAAAWNASIKQFRRDLKAMQELVANPKTDLHARIPWGDGQTVLREALLVADHNAYHVAQLVDVRRALVAWPEK